MTGDRDRCSPPERIIPFTPRSFPDAALFYPAPEAKKKLKK